MKYEKAGSLSQIATETVSAQLINVLVLYFHAALTLEGGNPELQTFPPVTHTFRSSSQVLAILGTHHHPLI